MLELPVAFEDKMKRILKDEYPAYLACYEEPRHYGLRVNTAKISPERFREICPFEIWPIPWIENGFYYDGETVTPAKHPYYHAGLYYLQEPSAMTPASRLPVQPGDKVLDLCAAPGGKATELGARLQDTGVLVANDISASRAKGLLKNLEVFGIGNVLVLCEEPGRLTRQFPAYFDKILIDAPCSGEGMFRKDRKMVRAWLEHGPDYFARIQHSIIRQALQMLRPGGCLLYSTCTFDERENEQIISDVLTEFPALELEDIRPYYEGFSAGKPELIAGSAAGLDRTVRIFPHKMRGEGHYLALLHFKDEDQAPCELSHTTYPPHESAEFAAFAEQLRRPLTPARLAYQGGKIYYMPAALPALSGLRFLRSGLLVGEVKKRRFEPSQALAMYLRREDFANVLDLAVADERVHRYLRGETLTLTEPLAKGYCLVCVDSFPLGWGKVTGTQLKNKYLPGWRMMS